MTPEDARKLFASVSNLNENPRQGSVEVTPEFLEALGLVAKFDNLGAHARDRRLALKYPQSSVARFVSLIHNIPWHQTVVAKIESGERALRANELFALANVYDIDVVDLLNGTNINARPRWIMDTTPDGQGIDLYLVKQQTAQQTQVRGKAKGAGRWRR